MDASECREYAARCIEMANAAPDEEQSMLFDLAAAWLRLAADLDGNETVRDKMKAVEAFSPRKVAVGVDVWSVARTVRADL